MSVLFLYGCYKQLASNHFAKVTRVIPEK